MRRAWWPISSKGSDLLNHIATAGVDSRRLLIIAAIAGISARLLFALTTVGTTDVLFKLSYARIAGTHSILYAYNYYEFMNHPPLSVLLMSWYLRIESYSGLDFPQVFRIVQTICDAITAAALCRLGQTGSGRNAAVAFLLCPAAIFITGFHCNTDPMMLMFLILAVVAARRDHFLLSGVLLGLSFGIKIVAMFVAPILFLAAGKRRWHFAAGFLSLAALVFVPTTIVGGPAVLTNVLGYSGWRSIWGVAGLAERIHHLVSEAQRETLWLTIARAYSASGTFLLGAVLVALYVVFWRRLRQSSAMDLVEGAVPVIFLIVLAVAPRFGVQYLMWPLPLLPFVLSRAMYAMTCAVFSVYLFAVYTIWAGEFPWVYADAMTNHPLKWILTDTGFLVWAWIVVAAILGFRRWLNSGRPFADRA